MGRQAAYNRQIIALLSLQKQHRVLDLGCGTGALTRAIGDRLDAAAGGMALGIDAAAAMIRVATKKRASTTCRFEVAAAESLPYDAASFDAVVSSLFFHHVDRDLKERALREAFRVLRPGRPADCGRHAHAHPRSWANSYPTGRAGFSCSLKSGKTSPACCRC